MAIGACLETLLMSFALSDRFNMLQRAREAADRRVEKLKNFLPQKVADLVVDGAASLLDPKKSEVTVCVIDLRGFTPFSEAADPDHVMRVLREFFQAMGTILEEENGTVEHFAGDGMVVFFNVPVAIENPEERALEAAFRMQKKFIELRKHWAPLGNELGLGIGVSSGIAVTGALGFSGREQYAAIGPVTNLASRLCSQAKAGEVLSTRPVFEAARELAAVSVESDQEIRGFKQKVDVVSWHYDR